MENFLTNASGWQCLASYYCTESKGRLCLLTCSNRKSQHPEAFLPKPKLTLLQPEALSPAHRDWGQGIQGLQGQSVQCRSSPLLPDSMTHIGGQKHKEGFKGTRRTHPSNVLDPYLDKPPLERLLFMQQLATLEHQLNS